MNDETNTGESPPQRRDATEDRLAKLNRQLPFSDEAERGVLSCILQDPVRRLSECRLTLPAEAMYHLPTRTVYATLLDMHDANVPVDVVTVSNRLRDGGLLERVGGPSAVSELYTFVPIDAHFAYYRKVVLSKWKLRQLIDASAENITDAYEHGKEAPDEDVEGLIRRAQERIINLSREQDSASYKKHFDVVLRVVDEVEAAMENTGHILPNRIATGFTKLDRMTGGLEGGQVFVIASRPSMGKSSLAENIYMNVAMGRGHYKEYNHPPKSVLVFSLEMSAESLVRRTIVGGAGLNLQAMRYGFKSRGDQDKIGFRVREVQGARVYYIDKPGLSIQHMRSLARIMHAQFGIAFISIDYLQLMISESRKAQGNRQVEIGEISRGCKEMAKELNVPVMVLSQLSRKCEERSKLAVPQLSDLRESGDIEQDADIVGLMYREWYYNREADETASKLIIAKGRDIGVGDVELEFHKETTRFLSLTDSLFSNDDDKRDPGYVSKPQPSKQKHAPEEVQEAEI